MESTKLSSSVAGVGVTRHAHKPSRNAPLPPNAIRTRRGLLAGIAVPALVMLQMDPAEAIGIEVTKVPAAAAEGIKRRDEAMEWRCKGGMFDCDGDRRDYAKKQYKDFLDKSKGPSKWDPEHASEREKI
ncbi:hypothetical protein BSKO_08044 [Bryopsis sp. KO-2023]|nr:hypothetical protein BSKO_08044 [Bryopsis sp. KO-2023]